MAILTDHFYHKTITLYNGVFGSVFNSIYIVRKDGNKIKVPIAYAGKNKNAVFNEVERNGKSIGFNQRLPRMAFLMTGLQKDTTRQTNKNNKLHELNPTNPLNKKYQYNRIPYIFEFELRAKTKNYDDMLQIIEQIVPSFSNEVQIIVKDNPDLNAESQLILQLTGTTLENQFEGMYEEPQVIETTFTFNLRGFLYQRTREQGVIQTIRIDYKDFDTEELLDQDVITDGN